jgi:hypothetical protein
MGFASPEMHPDDALHKKMKKWGIIKDDERLLVPIDVLFTDWSFTGHDQERPIDVSSELLELKKRVNELEKKVGQKRKPSIVDFIYARHRKELESKHFGKIVAIDTDSGKIASLGSTIAEAYSKAQEKTGKDKFDFRRVGYKALYKA